MGWSDLVFFWKNDQSILTGVDICSRRSKEWRIETLSIANEDVTHKLRQLALTVKYLLTSFEIRIGCSFEAMRDVYKSTNHNPYTKQHFTLNHIVFTGNRQNYPPNISLVLKCTHKCCIKSWSRKSWHGGHLWKTKSIFANVLKMFTLLLSCEDAIKSQRRYCTLHRCYWMRHIEAQKSQSL